MLGYPLTSSLTLTPPHQRPQHGSRRASPAHAHPLPTWSALLPALTSSDPLPPHSVPFPVSTTDLASFQQDIVIISTICPESVFSQGLVCHSQLVAPPLRLSVMQKGRCQGGSLVCGKEKSASLRPAFQKLLLSSWRQELPPRKGCGTSRGKRVGL